MKKRLANRISKGAKWGGVAVCVAMVVVWAVSVRWFVVYSGPNGEYFLVARGSVAVGRFTPPLGAYVGWDRGENQTPGFDWKGFSAKPANGWIEFVPLWQPGSWALVLTMCAWYLDYSARRPARVGMCRKCGYDLRGLGVGSVCPECGVLLSRQAAEGRDA